MPEGSSYDASGGNGGRLGTNSTSSVSYGLGGDVSVPPIGGRKGFAGGDGNALSGSSYGSVGGMGGLSGMHNDGSDNPVSGVVAPCGALMSTASCATSVNGETKAEFNSLDEGKVITDSDLASFSYGAGGGGGGYDGITSGNGGKGQGGFVYIWY